MIEVTLFDRMMWFLKEQMSTIELAKMLRLDLTVQAADRGFGQPEEVHLYEDHGEMIGIPRMYAWEKFRKEIKEFADSTFLPPQIDWPEFAGTLRPPQEQAVRNVLDAFETDKGKYGGLLEGKCGSGKTVVALAIAVHLQTPVLVLVHKNDLMDQWRDRIKEFLPGCRVGRVQQNVQDFEGKHITLAMMQSVRARRDQLHEREFYARFGMVIVDEGHHVPAVTFEEVIKCFYARYRLGLSATWRRKDGLACVFSWHLGPMLSRIQTESVGGSYVQLRWKPLFTAKDCKNHISNIVTSLSQETLRNAMICREVIKAIDIGRRVLVLSDRREHVELLVWAIRKMLLKDGKVASVGTYLGQMSKQELADAREMQAVIGTYGMFSEGTDVPEMDTLFFATPRKDVEQAVGRIQRPVEKRAPLIIDIVDGLGICNGMARARRAIFERVGFKEQEKNR